eukprot:gene37231-45193_t
MGKQKIKRSFTYLDEPPHTASVSQVILQCRHVLWGIVQKISIQQEFVEVEEAVTVDQELLGSMDLPSGFGTTSKNKKNKKRKRRMANPISLPSPVHNGIILESNVYLVFGHDQCDQCAVVCPQCLQHAPSERTREVYLRVIGVGPSQPAGQYAMVQPLNTPAIFEIPRSELRSIPPARFLEVCAAWKEDFYWRLDRGKPPDVHSKYWDQRYRLFGQFDKGLRLDAESWFSVTPEAIARYLAQACRELFAQRGAPLVRVLDGFAGCGGVAIQLAQVLDANNGRVCAVDIDASKLEHLMHNAKVYGVQERVECVAADLHVFLRDHADKAKLARMLGKIRQHYDAHAMQIPDLVSVSPAEEACGAGNAFDLVVLSPPWGGPTYLDSEEFDLSRMLPSGDGWQLAALAAACCANVALLLPRNTPDGQIKQLAQLLGTPYLVDYLHLHGKLKMKAVYLGGLLAQSEKASGEEASS